MTHLFSEIFCLTLAKPAFRVFQLSEQIDRASGNRFSSRFSHTFEGVLVVWERGDFYVLGTSDDNIPDAEVWTNQAREICDRLGDEIGDLHLNFQWRSLPDVLPASIVAKWGVQQLKLRSSAFEIPLVEEQSRVRITHKPEFWAETVEQPNGEAQAAIALTLKSDIVHQNTLQDIYRRYEGDLANLETRLTGMQVKADDRKAEITGFRGTAAERRTELLAKASRSQSHRALTAAADDEPIVGVRFRRGEREFHYALAALKPSVTQFTADRYQVDWGSLLGLTKTKPRERQQRLGIWKRQAEDALRPFGFELSNNLNSKERGDRFSILRPLNAVELEFGGRVCVRSNDIMTGLQEGGVFRRHETYRDRARPIRVSFLKVTDTEREVNFPRGRFYDRLRDYGFTPDTAQQQKYSTTGKTAIQVRTEVEELLTQMLNVPSDVFIVILPQSDRHVSNGDSLRDRIYKKLLAQHRASQFVYENTLRNRSQFKNILNQIVPGVLAKIGNLPYVLKEPLPIADRYIGFDISRSRLERGSGSTNACASARIYGARGEFVGYQVHSQAVDGEEIPRAILEMLLPASDFRDRTVLIYRDGRFVGAEVESLVAWSQAISARFILVESRKSQIPRLYSLQNGTLLAPPQGALLKLSERSGILVTTQVYPGVGLARPLRLNVRPEGHPASLEAIAEVSLKLTLLHHGSLRPPRLPVPLFAADKIAGLRRQGIVPGHNAGDRQFWL